ncbi:hypothetical protein AGMMS49983_20560 [Clostridia bacterium]|nr:hypothetical protein AGMMS49983_20560 [Clostridia bacterium]
MKVNTKKIKRGIFIIIVVGLAVLFYPAVYTAVLNDAIRNDDLNRVNAILFFPGELNRDNGLPEFPGASPLTEACIKGNVDIAKVLLEHGADVNYSGGGWAPMTMACVSRNPNQYDMVKLLIENGANTNLSSDGESPIFALLSPDNYLGKNPDYVDDEMINNIFRLLIDNGTSLDSSILYDAACDNNLGIVSYLIEDAGMIVDKQTLSAETALIGAARKNAVDVAEYLLIKGANPKIRDWYERTAMDYAIANKYDEIVELLKHYSHVDSPVNPDQAGQEISVAENLEMIQEKENIIDYVKRNVDELNNMVTLLNTYNCDIYFSRQYPSNELQAQPSENVTVDKSLVSMVENILNGTVVKKIEYVNGHCVIGMESSIFNRNRIITKDASIYTARWVVYEKDEPDVPEQYEQIVGNWYYREVMQIDPLRERDK